MRGLNRFGSVSMVAVFALVVTLLTPTQAQAEPAEMSQPIAGTPIPEVGELSGSEADRLALPAEPLPTVAPVWPAGKQDEPEPVLPSPAVQPTLKPRKLDPAKVAAEVEDLPVVSRDKFSTTYKRADGSNITQISEEPLNVETSAGEWEEVSTGRRPLKMFSSWEP